MAGDLCSPFSYREKNFSSICEYVSENSDICEGGGYILWTQLKVCTESPILQITIVVASLMFFIYLFTLLSTTADSFFCENIASIVDHHHISQNIAGITFMAFGNGAPDIFSSIASVLSVPNPQAGLAISELLGGGIFVTSIVVASIILLQPFDVMRRPIIRDIGFFLVALSLLVFFVLYDNQIHWWQPALFLAIYGIYAFTVISGALVRQRIRKQKRQSRVMTKAIVAASKMVPKKSKSVIGGSKIAPAEVIEYKEANKTGFQQSHEFLDDAPKIFTPKLLDKNGNIVESTTVFPIGKLIIPVGESGDSEYQDRYSHVGDYVEAGKFFVKEKLDNEEDSETTDSSLIIVGENNEKMALAAASNINRDTKFSSASTDSSLSSSNWTKQRKLNKFCSHLSPLDIEEFQEAKWYSKIYHIFKIPCMICLKVSVPLATVPWYKPLVVVHTFISPLVFCFAFKLIYLSPVPNGPGLYAYVLLCSTALSVSILLFTRSDKEPKYYKPFAAYAGFAMSIAWIYAAAAEVVNVVMMFGSLFGVSYQILGLTAVSWCNSIGDAIADFTVARQGFPRMGLSAAIGAPLFNLLVGFGATFSIAKLQGKTVTVSVDGVKWTMFAALGMNLISTLVLLYIQRFSMRILSCSSIVLFLLLNLVVFTSCKADDDFGDEDFVDETEQVAQTDAQIDSETSNEEYVAPAFATPTLDKYSVHFVDWFDDLKAIGKRWLKSTAQKEGAEEAVAKYNGEWAVGSPSNVVINNDYGLIVKTKARHHAIAASLNKPFRFEGKPLVVQYEVKYEEGQECGGGYVKLLSVDPKAAFHDKTPYTIMFGPDKCGMSAKAHFILRLKNPKNGSVSEYHAKQPTRSLAPFFDDKKTHLYTLIVKPTNDFQVLIDNAEIIAGNLLKDLEPSVVPPQQIHDPDDKKPEDWDDREFIVDPEAKKPDDWDESAPKEIVDTDAKKPNDWVEDEEQLIPDLNAKKPDDWDESIDGTWEAPKISNPKCEGVSGCGKWSPPMKANPQYKGKWTPPKVGNPTYKGKWSPRLIDNPHYFEADPYKLLDPISAIGFELWTMSSGIVFDNIIIADDIDLVRDFARQTFNVKVDQEKLFDAIANPSNIQTFWTTIKQATEERPWLWAVFVLVLLIPVILISVFCFGKKSPSSESHPKKTDEFQPDEEVDEEMEDPVEEGQPEGSPIDHEQPETSQNSSGKASAHAGNAKRRSRSRSGGRGSQSSEGSDEQTQQETQTKEPDSPSKPTRRTRIRRED